MPACLQANKLALIQVRNLHSDKNSNGRQIKIKNTTRVHVKLQTVHTCVGEKE